MSDNAADNKTSENPFQLFFKEPQRFLGIAYLLLILLGMLQEGVYYSTFKINIFEYSEVFDFLMAPFRHSISIVILCFLFFVSYALYLFDLFLQKNHPRIHDILNWRVNKKEWFQAYRIAAFSFFFLSFLFYYFMYNSNKQKNNLLAKETTNVKIVFDSQQNNYLVANKIGATTNYIFILDKEKQVQVVPFAKIERIYLNNNKQKGIK